MKNSYSRLCLKERWTMFTIFLIAGILCAAAAIYAFIKHYMTYTVTGSVLAIVSLLISGYIFQLNMRRKEIKKNTAMNLIVSYLRKKEHVPNVVQVLVPMSATALDVEQNFIRMEE